MNSEYGRDPLTASQRITIQILQLLSTLYDSESQARSVASSRMLSALLQIEQSIVEETLAACLQQGFVALQGHYPVAARISQETWRVNSSRSSNFYASFVFNAPASLRTPYSLFPLPFVIRAMPPEGSYVSNDGCNMTQSCSCTEASTFMGVTNYASDFGKPMSVPPPYEVALSKQCTTCPSANLSSNLFWLDDYRFQSRALYERGASGPDYFGDYMALLENNVGGDYIFLLLLADDVWTTRDPGSMVLRGAQPYGFSQSLAPAYGAGNSAQIQGATISSARSSSFTVLGRVLSGAVLLKLQQDIF